MRRLLEMVAVTALSAGVMAAQDASSPRMPPNYRGVRQHIDGIFVTPVAGAPFSATVEIVSHERLPDASEHVVTTHVAIGRTSLGKIYNERRRLVSTEYTGVPRLLSAHIYDPVTRQSIFLFPEMHLAREMTLRAPEHVPNQAQPPKEQRLAEGETESSLGTKEMDGLVLNGMKREHTVAAVESGTGKPVVVTDEYWYSPELSIYMLIRHDDPRTGEQLVAVTKVERAEPPASLFAVPEGYKVVDETTDEAPIAAQ